MIYKIYSLTTIVAPVAPIKPKSIAPQSSDYRYPRSSYANQEISTAIGSKLIGIEAQRPSLGFFLDFNKGLDFCLVLIVLKKYSFFVCCFSPFHLVYIRIIPLFTGNVENPVENVNNSRIHAVFPL